MVEQKHAYGTNYMPGGTLADEWKKAHNEAIEHARKGKHNTPEEPSENYKSGYTQGLTQAHNLRVSIKEHELPHWAKGK
jgi:hypothetical protein